MLEGRLHVLCGLALAALLSLSCVSGPAFAEDSEPSADALVPGGKLKSEFLVGILKNAGYGVTVDEDGDVCIETEEKDFWLGLEPEGRLSWLAIALFKDSATEAQKNGLANRINDRAGLIRAAVNTRNGMGLDLSYDLIVDAGVTPAQIIVTTEAFIQSVSAVSGLDAEGILK